MVDATAGVGIAPPARRDFPFRARGPGCAGWSSAPNGAALTAVKAVWVYLTIGNPIFNRSGLREAEVLQIMAEIFHPGLFASGHQGRGGVRL